MELRISTRNLKISDRFREYVGDRAAKVEQLSHRPQELHIKVTRHEHNRSGAEDQVELTVYEPGHVVRAEARAPEEFAAFDMAFGKLLERLRRYSDKKKVHRGGGHSNLGLSELSASDFSTLDVKPADYRVIMGEVTELPPTVEAETGESPVIIRRKEFSAEPMTVVEALDHMELVGHDFYLFRDSETSKASVVYRRKGYNYGLISLEG
jgi:ribosomal subunit interface protein